MSSKRRTANISSEVVEITPDMAEEWYLLSGGNRPIRKHHVAFLGRQMHEGKWELNGEAIIFDWDGKLIEGHHRLVACAEHKAPFKSLVVRGVDPDAKATINTGRSRCQGDALAFAGVGGHHALLSTTIMRLIEYESGRMSNPSLVKVSNKEVVAAYDRFPGLIDAIEKTGKIRKVMSASRYVWFFYLVARKHPAYANDFTESLINGVELAEDSPIYQLRQRLINANQRAGRRGISSMALNEQTAILVKAWNLYYRDKPCKALRWSKTEGFPKIDGI